MNQAVLPMTLLSSIFFETEILNCIIVLTQLVKLVAYPNQCKNGKRSNLKGSNFVEVIWEPYRKRLVGRDHRVVRSTVIIWWVPKRQGLGSKVTRSKFLISIRKGSAKYLLMVLDSYVLHDMWSEIR